MTREYKAVARHPGKGEAKNPGGPLPSWSGWRPWSLPWEV